MPGFQTLNMTTVATAAVVIFVSGCGAPVNAPVEAQSSQHGHLDFSLNDTTSARIPGRWQGDTLWLYNAEESLALTPLDTTEPTWSVPVFDGQITLSGDTGHWRDVLRPGDYRVPVEWRGTHEPDAAAEWSSDTLSWALTFGEEDPWNGQLFLQQSGSLCRGSIATATGDFRHLHGTLEHRVLTLQTFDGAHLFHFAAQVGEEGQLTDGLFLSGNHYHTPFFGTPVDASESAIHDVPIALWTGLPVRYSGVNVEGDSVVWSASDAQGVHVLSVMGSWCPNCMDEHRLLLRLLDRFPDLHIHTLAFERGLQRDGGASRALDRLRRYAQQMGMDRHADRWSLQLVGPASKTAAQEALPFLDRVVSFPTTIAVGPNQREPWIHSGFNGPATGPAYDAEIARFAAAISGLSENR